MHKLEVHILTYQGRLALLQKCVLSTLKALSNNALLTVTLNGPAPESKEWLSSLKDARLKINPSVKKHRSTLRNEALKDTKAALLYFLDDDVVVPSHLFTLASDAFSKDPTLGVLGGPNLTPPNVSQNEIIFGALLSSPLSAPLVYKRYFNKNNPFVLKATQHELILCNFCVRPETLKDLKFLDNIESNEENLFLEECKKNAISCGYLGDLFVYHHRRKTVMSFLSQINSYGRGRAQQFFVKPKSCHPLFLAPLLLFLFVIGGLLTTPTYFLSLFLWYVFFCGVACLLNRPLRTLGINAVIRASIITSLMHLSYGCGMCWEGIKFLIWAGNQRQVKHYDKYIESLSH